MKGYEKSEAGGWCVSTILAVLCCMALHHSFLHETPTMRPSVRSAQGSMGRKFRGTLADNWIAQMVGFDTLIPAEAEQI